MTAKLRNMKHEINSYLMSNVYNIRMSSTTYNNIEWYINYSKYKGYKRISMNIFKYLINRVYDED